MAHRHKFSIRKWLKGFMLKHMHGMITCHQFEEFVFSYLEGSLPARQCKVFELHLRVCRECREYLAAYQRTIELGQAMFSADDESLPEDVPEDLITAILDARNQ